jgi:putative redox protein
MTLRMYAERKELPLTRVTVTLGHEKVEVEGRGRIDRITRRISLEGNLTPEQRERMLEIANRCPVHRTLSGNLDIDSQLTE